MWSEVDVVAIALEEQKKKAQPQQRVGRCDLHQEATESPFAHGQGASRPMPLLRRLASNASSALGHFGTSPRLDRTLSDVTGQGLSSGGSCGSPSSSIARSRTSMDWFDSEDTLILPRASYHEPQAGDGAEEVVRGPALAGMLQRMLSHSEPYQQQQDGQQR